MNKSGNQTHQPSSRAATPPVVDPRHDSESVTEPGALHPARDKPAALIGVKIQLQSMPSADAKKGKWKQPVGAARLASGKLSEDTLHGFAGPQPKRTGPIEEEAAITRDEAELQVKRFFNEHES